MKKLPFLAAARFFTQLIWGYKQQANFLRELNFPEDKFNAYFTETEYSRTARFYCAYEWQKIICIDF